MNLGALNLRGTAPSGADLQAKLELKELPSRNTEGI